MHPALAHRSILHLDPVITEDGHRLERDFLAGRHVECLVERHERRVDIIVVHLLEAQHAGAQPEVTVQRGQRLVHFLDERAVDGRRDVVLVQLPIQHAVVVARLGERRLRLEVRVQDQADGVAVLLPLAPERVEGEFAILPDLASAYLAVALRVDSDFLARRQSNGRPGDVRVGQHAVGVARGVECLREIGQRLLGFLAKRVRSIAQRIVELEGKRREPLVFMDVGLDDLAAYRDDFGLHPGGCLVETGKHDLANCRRS